MQRENHLQMSKKSDIDHIRVFFAGQIDWHKMCIYLSQNLQIKTAKMRHYENYHPLIHKTIHEKILFHFQKESTICSS
jgi:hypothetical protein